MNLAPHHHPVFTKRFFSGAARDLGRERDVRDKEYYFDALNMRPTSIRGNLGDMERIGGAVLDFQHALSETYVCIISFLVGERIVAIWVDEDELLEPVITVDNYIVCRADSLPFYLGVHLQFDIDDFQGGGFFAITNNETPPLIFDIQDMLDNVSESKYFTDFILQNYEINLTVPLDHPVFIDLESIGGTSGAPSGQNEYFLRYTTLEGDKTLLSAGTPPILVPNTYDFFDRNYLPYNIFPYYKTRGKDASEFNSPYGVKIRFRVNNSQNYDFVEILRASYSKGEGIGYTPTIFVIKKIQLGQGEISVKDYTDCEANNDELIALTSIETQTYLSTIKRAFSLRFFNKKLVLTNIEYDSFDLSDITFKEFFGGDTVKAITDLLSAPSSRIGVDNSSFSKTVGFKNAWNSSYKKTYMHSERYGIGILGFGSTFEKSFVKKVTGATNFTMPQRRDEIPSPIEQYCIEPVTACTVDNVVGKTYEVFDLTEAKFRDTAYDNGYVNIIDSGISSNYAPRYPNSVADLRNSHYLRNVIAVKYAAADLDVNYYDPYGYGERYHSLGGLLAGIQDYPENMKAFSIVRTKKAGRVICQGLASFHWTESGTPASYTAKSRSEIRFYSPDIKNGVIDSSILSNISINPTQYKVVIESPVGYFMDVYNAINADSVLANCKIDMILGANVYVEQDDKRINLGEAANTIGVPNGADGYTAYGKYRNAAHGAGDSIYGDGQDGTYKLTISEFEEVTTGEEEGVTYFRIKFTENLYKTADVGSILSKEFDQVNEFHEPFYIVSIIDDGKEIADSNVQEYIKTEHYQKIESLIGVSSGSVDQIFIIVDEREEDFFVIPGEASTNKFIFIDTGGGERLLYINISEKSVGDISDIDDDIANGTTLYCGEEIFGKFKAYYEDGFFYISFDSDCTIPASGSFIYVLYDSRFPTKFFGGDSVTHNCYAPMINRKTDNSKEISDSELLLGLGMPYYTFDMNPDIYVVRKTDPIDTESGVENQDRTLDYVRQMIISFPCTSYSNLAMSYNPHFPLVNYVHRPAAWNDNIEPSEQNIFLQYELDYPNEKDRWNFGGFRFPQTFVNLDYSKESTSNIYFSIPEIGFTIESTFYNRYAWSLSKAVNTSKIPSWRTFLNTNIFDGTDKYGQNKYLFSQRIVKGSSVGLENLICFNEETAFELYTERVYISSADGNTLQTVGATGFVPFISEETPLRGENGRPAAGMPSYLWRFAGELQNSIYYFDKSGAHRVSDKYQEISLLYNSKLNTLLSSLPSSFSSDINYQKYIDLKNREYGLRVKYSGYKKVLDVDGTIVVPYGVIQGCVSGNAEQDASKIVFQDMPDEGTFTYCISNVGSESVHVFIDLGGLFVVEVFEVLPSTTVTYTVSDGSLTYETADGLGDCDCCEYVSFDMFPIFSEREEVFNWIGEYDYDYDYFCSSLDVIYGFKDGARYRLDEHAYPMKSHLDVMFSPEIGWFKEFVRFNISSSKKPDRVYFKENDESVIGTVLAANIKPYGSGFEQFIPLNSLTRKRIQKKSLLQRIEFDSTSDDVIISSSSIQYRKIK